MIKLRHSINEPSIGTQKIQFEFHNSEDVHGVLSLLKLRENYVYSQIRAFHEIPDDKALLLNINLKETYDRLDFAWERRVKYIYRYMLELEKLMWNLSTLGGAYSAMGDFDSKYAEFAAKITAHQICLAKKYGDPTILARCYLYTALAEAQLGYISRAVSIVRAVNRWAKQNQNTEIVLRCCEGVYQKLRAIRIFGKIREKI